MSFLVLTPGAPHPYAPHQTQHALAHPPVPPCLCTQHLRFGTRDLRLTIAALPAFISTRQSDMPTFVLAFNLATVTFIAVLIGMVQCTALVLSSASALSNTASCRMPSWRLV